MSDQNYAEIMKIAFQAEEAINDEVIAKFGKKYGDKTVLINRRSTGSSPGRSISPARWGTSTKSWPLWARGS